MNLPSTLKNMVN